MAKTSPKRKPTNAQDPYTELTERYKDDPAVRKRIVSLLRQREAFPDDFEAEMIGVALDELLENEKTPVGFRHILSDYLHAVAKHTGACGWRDPEELYNVKEWFDIAMEAMEEEGEPPHRKDVLIANTLSDLLEHPAMPEEVARLIREGLALWSDEAGCSDPTTRDQLAIWIPLVLEDSGQQGEEREGGESK